MLLIIVLITFIVVIMCVNLSRFEKLIRLVLYYPTFKLKTKDIVVLFEEEEGATNMLLDAKTTAKNCLLQSAALILAMVLSSYHVPPKTLLLQTGSATPKRFYGGRH